MASREEFEYSSQAPAGYIGQFLNRGIFPYAARFLKQQFDDYGQADSSPFTYTGQRVADFDPREQYAMQLSDQAIGSYRPYLGAQASTYGQARQALGQGLGQFDPTGISGFYDPYEEQVVQQTLQDVREGLAKGDMGLRDEAVGSGAFGGARSRLRRGELAEDTARGAAQAIGGIRSAGYQGARQAAQDAFESQQTRRLQGGQFLGGLGNLYGGMAAALPGLQQQDIQRMMGMGGLGRGRSQSLMDLGYQNFVGQYNLPMQTLQNVGSLTAALGQLAVGYGYAGAIPAANAAYTPLGAGLPFYGGSSGFTNPTVGVPGAYNNPAGFAGRVGSDPASNPTGRYAEW